MGKKKGKKSVGSIPPEDMPDSPGGPALAADAPAGDEQPLQDFSNHQDTSDHHDFSNHDQVQDGPAQSSQHFEPQPEPHFETEYEPGAKLNLSQLQTEDDYPSHYEDPNATLVNASVVGAYAGGPVRPISPLPSPHESADYHTAESHITQSIHDLRAGSVRSQSPAWTSLEEPRTPQLGATYGQAAPVRIMQDLPNGLTHEGFSERDPSSRPSTSFGGRPYQQPKAVNEPVPGLDHDVGERMARTMQSPLLQRFSETQHIPLSRSPSRAPSSGYHDAASIVSRGTGPGSRNNTPPPPHHQRHYSTPPTSVPPSSIPPSALPTAMPLNPSSTGSTQPGLSVGLDGFVSAVHQLTASPDYRMVQDVFGSFLQLRDHNARLSISHREVLEEYRRFKNELEAQEAALVGVRRQLEGTVRAQERELDDHAAARGQLEAALATANGMLVDLGQAKGRVEQELHNTRRREEELGVLRAQLELDLQVAREDAYRIGGEKMQMESELMAVKGERDGLREEGEGLKEARDKLESDLQWADAELSDLKSTKSKLTEELETANVELEALRAAKARLEGELASATGERDELRGKSEQLETDLDTSNTELAQVRDAKAHLERDLESKTTELYDEKAQSERLVLTTSAEISDLKSNIDKLEDELATETRRANDMTSEKEELETKLRDTEEELHRDQAKLMKLNSYRIKLENEPDDFYGTVLDKIWTSVINLVTDTFSQDLPKEVLSDPSGWTALQQSEHLRHASSMELPLPQSNTPAAKHMRITAVLTVIARVLSKHIFRPVYLLDDAISDAPLVSLLRLVESSSPSAEAHYRATLLNILPHRQAASAARRVAAAVRDVSWPVQHLLGALQYDAFCDALLGVVEQACALWKEHIQPARLKIEPYFGPPFEYYDWQVLALPELDDGRDDMAVELGREIKDGDDGGDKQIDTTSLLSEVEMSDILLVAWPSFCVVENGTVSSLTQGLVVSKRQARGALEEVRARVVLRARKARTMSMPGNGGTGKEVAKSFLGSGPEGDGGGVGSGV